MITFTLILSILVFVISLVNLVVVLVRAKRWGWLVTLGIFTFAFVVPIAIALCK